MSFSYLSRLVFKFEKRNKKVCTPYKHSPGKKKKSHHTKITEVLKKVQIKASKYRQQFTPIKNVWQGKSRHISTVSNTESFLLAGWIARECHGIFRRIVITVKLLAVSLSVQAWRATCILSPWSYQLKYLTQRHITEIIFYRSQFDTFYKHANKKNELCPSTFFWFCTGKIHEVKNPKLITT